MNSDKVKELIHKLAIEYNLTDKDIQEIVAYQFKFLRRLISSRAKKKFDYNDFRIKLLGMFYVPKYKIKLQKEKYYEKKDSDAG